MNSEICINQWLKELYLLFLSVFQKKEAWWLKSDAGAGYHTSKLKQSFFTKLVFFV